MANYFLKALFSALLSLTFLPGGQIRAIDEASESQKGFSGDRGLRLVLETSSEKLPQIRFQDFYGLANAPAPSRKPLPTYEHLELRYDGKVVGPVDSQSYLWHVDQELLAGYDLLLYINKARNGLLAQRLVVLEKPDRPKSWRDWRVKAVWPVSTGREQQEKKGFTGTITGIFALSPQRLYRHYESRLYDGAPMPYAMFLDYFNPRFGWTGIALHAASSATVNRLGGRASGGCVRLAPENARQLFSWVTNDYKGQMPQISRWENGEINRFGLLDFDSEGRVKTREGNRVLVVIDDGGVEVKGTWIQLTGYSPPTKPPLGPWHSGNESLDSVPETRGEGLRLSQTLF